MIWLQEARPTGLFGVGFSCFRASLLHKVGEFVLILFLVERPSQNVAYTRRVCRGSAVFVVVVVVVAVAVLVVVVVVVRYCCCCCW